MKKKLKIFIQKTFYFFGFYPPEKVVPVSQFSKHIQKTPPLFREYLLKTTTEKILRLNAQTYYDKLLRNLIPTLDMHIQKANFIIRPGHGIGESSLAAFRKIQTKKNVFFEKVYFTSYPDLKRVEWFDEYICPIIQHTIICPRIYKVYKTDFVNIVYYEFLSLKEFPQRKKIKELIKVSKKLYYLSEENKKLLYSLNKGSFIFDYKTHFEYRKNIKLAKKRLFENKIFFRTFETNIQKSKKVFTHGDLYKTNIYAPNILIDWDTFGIYPLGFEIAFLYHRLLWGNDMETEFFKWLYANYKNSISKEDWFVFEKNTVYFLYVFSSFYFAKNERKLLEKSLLDKLKSLP